MIFDIHTEVNLAILCYLDTLRICMLMTVTTELIYGYVCTATHAFASIQQSAQSTRSELFVAMVIVCFVKPQQTFGELYPSICALE